MIKIVLRMGFAAWEKDNKRYTCIRNFNGKKVYPAKKYISCLLQV